MKSYLPFTGVFKLGSRIFQDLKENLHGMNVRVWGISLCHFNGCNSKGPNVCLAIIAIFLDNLWAHPVGSTDKGIPLGHRIIQLGRNAKISFSYYTFMNKQRCTVCMYVCMYVFVYICICMYLYIYICMYFKTPKDLPNLTLPS